MKLGMIPHRSGLSWLWMAVKDGWQPHPFKNTGTSRKLNAQQLLLVVCNVVRDDIHLVDAIEPGNREDSHCTRIGQLARHQYKLTHPARHDVSYNSKWSLQNTTSLQTTIN